MIVPDHWTPDMSEEEMVECYIADGWDRESAEVYAAAWHLDWDDDPNTPFLM